jgi:hypothetical protein
VRGPICGQDVRGPMLAVKIKRFLETDFPLRIFGLNLNFRLLLF